MTEAQPPLRLRRTALAGLLGALMLAGLTGDPGRPARALARMGGRQRTPKFVCVVLNLVAAARGLRRLQDWTCGDRISFLVDLVRDRPLISLNAGFLRQDKMRRTPAFTAPS